MKESLHLTISRRLRGYFRMKTLSRNGVGYLADTPQGLFVVDPRDFWITRSLLKRGTYDQDAIAFLSRFVTPESTICFVGAHIGTLLVPLAAKAARVIAYEANPSNFRYLDYNVRLNGLARAAIHNLAVGDRDGTEVLIRHETSNTGHSSIKLGGGEGTRVPMVTLDQHLRDEPHLRLMVMDIEGAEVHALRGMQRTLGKLDYLYTEFCPRYLAGFGESGASFADALAPHFRHMYVCGGATFENGSWQDFLRRIPASGDAMMNLIFTNESGLAG